MLATWLKRNEPRRLWICQTTHEYRSLERMSAGISFGLAVTRILDTVYFNEELAHDFASWVAGDLCEPKYQNGSVALIRETGFDYDGRFILVCKPDLYQTGLSWGRWFGVWFYQSHHKDIFISYEEDPRIVGQSLGNFKMMEGQLKGYFDYSREPKSDIALSIWNPLPVSSEVWKEFASAGRPHFVSWVAWIIQLALS